MGHLGLPLLWTNDFAVFATDSSKTDVVRSAVHLETMRAGPNVIINDDGSLSSPSSNLQNHIAFFGPYIRLFAGRYETTLKLEVANVNGSGSLECEVYLGQNKRLAAKRVLMRDAYSEITVQIPYELSRIDESKPLEFRVWKDGSFEATLKDISLTYLGGTAP